MFSVRTLCERVEAATAAFHLLAKVKVMFAGSCSDSLQSQHLKRIVDDQYGYAGISYSLTAMNTGYLLRLRCVIFSTA